MTFEWSLILTFPMTLKIMYIGEFIGHVFPRKLTNIDVSNETRLCRCLNRIGRTGRAGKKGTAVSFFVLEKNQRLARDLAELLKRTNQNIPPELLGGGYGSSYTSSGGYKGNTGGGRSW